MTTALDIDDFAAHSQQTKSELQALRDALAWYEAQALEMQRATLRNDSKRMLDLMRELSLDGGSRARRAAE